MQTDMCNRGGARLLKAGAEGVPVQVHAHQADRRLQAVHLEIAPIVLHLHRQVQEARNMHE